MFNHLHYVPILKSMEAEFVALRQLPADLRGLLTPLINILPPKMDHKKGKPKKALDVHLYDVGIKISKSWGIDYPVFIDPFYITSSDYKAISGRHPYIYFWELARRQYVKIIPVVYLQSDENYLKAVKQSIIEDNNGICLRIVQDDIDNADSLEETIHSLMALLNVTSENTDIVLDFKSLPLQDVGDPPTYIRNILKNFPNLSAWRTFTIAASSFPKSLRDMAEESHELIPREEFTIWKNILAKGGQHSRHPAFGDYAIDHPTYQDLKYGKPKIPVTLRYTTPSHWLVFKKREKNEYGHNQFYDLCRELVGRKDYCDPSFSVGDKRIHLCSTRSTGPGGPPQWKQIGFNHHFTLVAQQVANYRASS